VALSQFGFSVLMQGELSLVKFATKNGPVLPGSPLLAQVYAGCPTDAPLWLSI
jgi:hypothetical protein